MQNTRPSVNKKQAFFQEMVLGTLLYAVVLGFFEDYTSILNTWSYSVTFFAALVMQILTYITFKLKSQVVNTFKGKEGKKYTVYIVFGVWLIMFISKFIFLAVLDFIFGSAVEISGFIGLVLIILTMALAKKLIDHIYNRLA